MFTDLTMSDPETPHLAECKAHGLGSAAAADHVAPDLAKDLASFGMGSFDGVAGPLVGGVVEDHLLFL